jgi:dTDP-4-dehydrorhamnose reductase
VLLITGTTGLLGASLASSARARGLEVRASARAECDLANPGEADRLVRGVRPDSIVHPAAVTEITACERDPSKAWAVNAGAVAEVARAAKDVGARLLFVSTDLVFDGEGAPYREDAPTRPLSVYGRTKALGEKLARDPGSLVVRLPLLYGRSPSGTRSASERVEIEARETGAVTLFDDEWRTPLEVSNAAEALLDLLEAAPPGLYHLGGPDRVTRREVGEAVLRAAGIEAKVRAVSRTTAPGPPRPRDLSLDPSKARPMLRTPLLGLRDGLARVYGAGD